ncbi:MAG: hypothetical protein M3O29_02535 [Actinomycetota bacterium]|nr:hypothetical protein [Actinomycetota bacterium]
MPEATTVWMVELDRSPDDIEGTLTLEERSMRFAPAQGETAREIELIHIHRVKRIWGSPVLMVHSLEEGTRRVTAFYFSKPPPLHPAVGERDEPPPTLLGPFNRNRPPSKRKQRRSNASYLASASGALGEDVRTWVKEARAAIAAVRSASA